MAESMNRLELQSLMRLDDILRQCQHQVEVLDCGARDGGVGVQNIMTWIQQNVKPSTSSWHGFSKIWSWRPHRDVDTAKCEAVVIVVPWIWLNVKPSTLPWHGFRKMWRCRTCHDVNMAKCEADIPLWIQQNVKPSSLSPCLHQAISCWPLTVFQGLTYTSGCWCGSSMTYSLHELRDTGNTSDALFNTWCLSVPGLGYMDPESWNALLSAIRAASLLASFQQKLKRTLF